MKKTIIRVIATTNSATSIHKAEFDTLNEALHAARAIRNYRVDAYTVSIWVEHDVDNAYSRTIFYVENNGIWTCKTSYVKDNFHSTYTDFRPLKGRVSLM